MNVIKLVGTVRPGKEGEVYKENVYSGTNRNGESFENRTYSFVMNDGVTSFMCKSKQRPNEELMMSGLVVVQGELKKIYSEKTEQSFYFIDVASVRNFDV